MEHIAFSDGNVIEVREIFAPLFVFVFVCLFSHHATLSHVSLCLYFFYIFLFVNCASQ